MRNRTVASLLLVIVFGLALSGSYAPPARAQDYSRPSGPGAQDYPRPTGPGAQDYPRPTGPGAQEDTYTSNEIKNAGHRFFGSVSEGLALAIEELFSRYGRPNGYILGEEGGGAFIAGLRYGEGIMYTRNAGTPKLFWQGPSLGWDFGADAAKTMILVYNLASLDDIYTRYPGVAGAAYFIGGVGVTVMSRNDVVIAPIRAGVGARLGVNVGYLKISRRPTWNPF